LQNAREQTLNSNAWIVLHPTYVRGRIDQLFSNAEVVQHAIVETVLVLSSAEFRTVN